jgi:anti-sigma factor RsiW
MNGALHPDELLPWYANRSLAGAEHDAVEAHLRECARCRAELEFLGALREGVKRSAPAQVADEVGLRRLLRDVRRERARPQRRMALAAAAALLIVVQAGLIGWLATREPAIEPLGERAPAGVVLQLRFDPAASEARIRALLQEHDAVVIDGPSALGVYRVRLNGVRSGDEQAAAKALAEFRAARGVIAQAELQ